MSVALIRAYYRLAKPGIIYGNLLTTAGGFLYACGPHIYGRLFMAALSGTGLIIASACICNNYLDQDIDSMMDRTKLRPLINGDISEGAALTYAAILGISGVVILWLFTNVPTLFLGLLGFISYVFLYTPSKRETVHSTLIGSISGATPIAAGYTAVTGHFDWAAALLFLIMVIWQMPHFYAIGIFRRDDYARAGLPILPVEKGIAATKQQIAIYICLFVIAVASLALFGYASFSFFVIMVGIGLYWLWQAVQGIRRPVDDIRWARKVFGTSLLILLVLSITLSLDFWLP